MLQDDAWLNNVKLTILHECNWPWHGRENLPTFTKCITPNAKQSTYDEIAHGNFTCPVTRRLTVLMNRISIHNLTFQNNFYCIFGHCICNTNRDNGKITATTTITTSFALSEKWLANGMTQELWLICVLVYVVSYNHTVPFTLL